MGLHFVYLKKLKAEKLQCFTQKPQTANNNTGHEQYLLESRFLDTVHIRTGRGLYLISCCFVANCAVHKWL